MVPAGGILPGMSNDATPKLALPYLAEGQAQKHLTVNEALARLDGLVQCAVESRTTTAQPASPDDGAVYLLPSGRTGAAWALHPAGTLMRFEVNAWEPLSVGVGALAYVKDEALFIVRASGGWAGLATAFSALQNLTRLGIGATADATNPLSAKLNKALFAAKTAAEGGDGDLRITLNKETAGDVLSLLFQRGFSGRAELGLIGDDGLSAKVSGDGSSWTEALRIDSGGRVRQPAKPAASAVLSGNVTLTASYATLVFGTVIANAGGAYDAATGVFTCPTAGLYRVDVELLLNSSTPVGGGAQVQLRRNGSSVVSGGGRLAYIHQGAGGQYFNGGFSTVVACDAGDTLSVAASQIAAGTSLFGGDVSAVSFEFTG